MSFRLPNVKYNLVIEDVKIPVFASFQLFAYWHSVIQTHKSVHNLKEKNMPNDK